MSLSRNYINKRGPRTAKWDNARAQLKREFIHMGVTTCELNYPGCWRDDGLGFAHKTKRRKIDYNNPEELKEVILGRNHCHDILEAKPSEVMQAEVEQIILERDDRILMMIF